MKIRLGFVSNSSSSSFIVNKKYLSDEQINMIKNHIDIHNSLLKECKEYYEIHSHHTLDDKDAWDVSEENSELIGYTSMDNFPMK